MAMSLDQTKLAGQPVATLEGKEESALDNVIFYFRVLLDQYHDWSKRYFRRIGVDHVMRPGFGFVLIALYEAGSLRPSEISRRSGLQASTLTCIIDQMVKNGLVKRQPDPHDRRAIQLRLTRKAQRIQQQ